MNGVGLVVGAMAGTGALLLLGTVAAPNKADGTARRSRPAPVSPNTAAWCASSFVVAGMLALAITAVPFVALLAALGAGSAPVLVVRRREAAARRAVRDAWPDAVDQLLSSVRAGLSLPEAIADLGRVGPLPLRASFARFADDHRVTGAFGAALDALQDDLADPVADRVCAALRLAREVGGTDLGAVLSALSAMLREESRIRGEIAARQSWTVSAARLAVAAPWLTLAILGTRPEAARAYATAAGALVLAVAAGLSVAAYVAMRRIGRMPTDERMAA